MSDVPMSVSVVSGKVIEALGISTALDMSYRVPGLVVQEAGPGSQMYTLRGVGNSVGLFRLVGVYLDEDGISNPYESFASGTQPSPPAFGIRLAWGFH
ncbi:MAG: Plug domain-containing protein [Xanthomonadales bacterium]|nr:Plug domain-containing protein [Xanthomonadales bacterium]